MKRVLVLDVCGTLYRGNSTLDFCKFLSRKSRKSRGHYQFLCALRFLVKIGRKSNLVSKRHGRCLNDFLERNFFVGMDLAYLRQESSEFWVRAELRGLINKELLDFRDYDEVCLASAAAPFLIESLAEKINSKVLVRKYFIDEKNRLAGFEGSILVTKPLLLIDKYAGDHLTFYSDNEEDFVERRSFQEFIYVK